MSWQKGAEDLARDIREGAPFVPRNPADRPATEPRTDLEDALRELIRVSKSAGMNAASDFGYLPSTQQADEEEISEAVQSVHAAIGAEAAQGAAPRAEGLREALERIARLLDGDRCYEALEVAKAALSRPSDERVPEEER